MFRGTTFFYQPSFINYIRLYPHGVDGYNPYKQTWLENPSRPPRPSWWRFPEASTGVPEFLGQPIKA